MKSTDQDAELCSKVADELAWDVGVDADSIQVAASAGIVTLTGIAHSYAAKLAAQEAAHRISGVCDVANDINVVLTGNHTDTEIAQAVRAALEWDVLVPHKQIQTTITNGWVTLDGSVVHLNQREAAAYVVRRLAGVRGISNRIQVEPDAAVPEEAHEAIRAALKRQAGREADRVEVTGRGGNIVLTGSVHSWAERRAVLGAAGHAPGVRSIEDHLRVDHLS